MKPYSLDLRQRVIDLYQERPSYNAVGKQLKVSHTWVRNLVRLWQSTGTLDAQYQNCGRPPTITERDWPNGSRRKTDSRSGNSSNAWPSRASE